MKTRENVLLLLSGPAVVAVGVDILSRDITRGLIVISMSVFLTIIGSYYQWVDQKKRSKLWLLSPAVFSAVGYIPLMLLAGKSRVSNIVGESLTSVAVHITKYYLEMKRSYRGSFRDEATLLAAAGLLEARSHIDQEGSFLEERFYMEQKISPEQILDIAQKSVLADGVTLTDFIINLGMKLFHIEAPEYAVSEVTEACLGKRRDVEVLVEKMEREYTHEPGVASLVSRFMLSYNFQGFRSALGIKD